MIDNGQVFAIGQGGRMVALELITGQRIWELNFAGIATPWVAGDWVFVGHRRGQADRGRRANGQDPLDHQLPRFEHDEEQERA